MDELKNTHYDAFISYRHSETDSFVAENLHKRLESFKLPKSVRPRVKDGKTSIERVFRDVDELPLSDNLSEPISNALANSDYLITICTPRYPQSRWCLKEIETFLQTHPRDHILVVLAEGEPADSFPEILTYEQTEVKDENGNVSFSRREIEPLAADTRGSNKKEILRAMDITVLKLCAAMFGLNYDDLKQRRREARMRKMMTVLGITGAFFFCFAAVVTGMLIKISRQNGIISSQYSQLMDKYADAAADKAAGLFACGRRRDAAYTLRSVLPDDPAGEINASALRELYRTMGVYPDDGTYFPGETYDMDSEIYAYSISDNGDYILVNDLLSMKLFDGSGKVIRRFDNPDTYSFVEGLMVGNGGAIYVSGGELRFYDIEDDEDIVITDIDDACTFYETCENIAVVFTDGKLMAVDDSGALIYTIDLSDLTDGSDHMSGDLDSEKGFFAFSFSDSDGYHVMAADLYSGEVTYLADVKSDIYIPVCMNGDHLYYCATEYGVDDEAYSVTVHAVRERGGVELFSVKTDRFVNDMWGNGGYLYAYTDSGLEVINSKTGDNVALFMISGELTCGIESIDGMILIYDSGMIYKAEGDACYEITDTILPKGCSMSIERMATSGICYYVLFERANYISAFYPVITLDGESDAAPDYDELYGEDATFDLQDDEDFNSLLLDQAVYSADGNYIAASYSNHTVKILNPDTYDCLGSYDMDEYVLSLKYSDVTESYILGCDGRSYILDGAFNIICEMGMIVGEDGGRLDLMTGCGEVRHVEWIDYNELISMTDEYLGDYIPRGD